MLSIGSEVHILVVLCGFSVRVNKTGLVYKWVTAMETFSSDETSRTLEDVDSAEMHYGISVLVWSLTKLQ